MTITINVAQGGLVPHIQSRKKIMSTVIYEQPRNLPRISWGAIFAGAVLALVIYLVCGVLGSAVGSSVVAPTQDQNPLAGFSFAAGVWIMVATVISLAVGSYYAGRSAQTLGWLHGVLTWCLVTLITTYALTAVATGAIGAAASVLGKGIAVAGEGVAKATPIVADKVKDEMEKSGVSLDFDNLQQEFEALLQQSGKPELSPENIGQKTRQAQDDAKATAQQSTTQPQQADIAFKQWLDRVRKSAAPALNAADKEALVNVIVARTGKSHGEAQAIADNYEQTYNQAMASYLQLKQQAEQKMRAAADVAARNLARASWWTFAALVVGAIVSGAAGNLGFRHQPPFEENETIREDVISVRN